MAWKKDKGIILGAIRHNDRSCVVHMFTELDGYVPFIFYSPARATGARRNALLQPLTVIGMETSVSSDGNLSQLREPSNILPFKEITLNPLKSCIALFTGEFLTYALRNEDTNIPLFSFLHDTVAQLDSAADVSNAHLYIMLKVAAYLGIAPNTDNFLPGSRLDMENGTFTTFEPDHQNYLDPDESHKLKQLLESGSLAEAAAIPMTGRIRFSLLNSLNTYFRLHRPEFPQLKSLEVLQAVFFQED